MTVDLCFISIMQLVLPTAPTSVRWPPTSRVSCLPTPVSVEECDLRFYWRTPPTAASPCLARQDEPRLPPTGSEELTATDLTGSHQTGT